MSMLTVTIKHHINPQKLSPLIERNSPDKMKDNYDSFTDDIKCNCLHITKLISQYYQYVAAPSC